MYRALTWLALEHGIDVEDEASLACLAREAAIEVGDEEGQVTINGQPVPLEPRRREIDQKVSLVATVAQVRESLVRRQRDLAKGGRIVVAGRDIGTVVLPNAPLKLFFLASTPERANRRYRELRDRRHDVEHHRILEEMETRDKLDSQRTHSPLRPATDAHIINTDGVNVEQVVEIILKLIKDP